VVIFKKFLLPLQNMVQADLFSGSLAVSFSPKKPFQIVAERRQSRREATSENLKNPVWRCFLDEVRTFFEQNPE
jgi:hypothetical protein